MARRALIALDTFAALSAGWGGVLVITGWPYRFPLSYLAPTPFTDYTVPGLILGLVVGGSAALAAWATLRSPTAGSATSAFAGLVMIGWIIGEYLLVPAIRWTPGEPTTWLQPFYLAVGVGMVALALRIAPDAWPSRPRTARPV